MLVRHREWHRTEHVGWLRAAVLGANDGILSTASLGFGGRGGAWESQQCISGRGPLAWSLALCRWLRVSTCLCTRRQTPKRPTSRVSARNVFPRRSTRPDVAHCTCVSRRAVRQGQPMTGLSRREHFIEIPVSKPDWDTCGVAFRELVLDPLGQALLRPRRDSGGGVSTSRPMRRKFVALRTSAPRTDCKKVSRAATLSALRSRASTHVPQIRTFR
jgi:hypothetical protein